MAIKRKRANISALCRKAAAGLKDAMDILGISVGEDVMRFCHENFSLALQIAADEVPTETVEYVPVDLSQYELPAELRTEIETLRRIVGIR